MCALMLIGATQFLNAQVSGYIFSQNVGTWNSISASGVLVTGSDATATTTYDTSGWNVAIPFGFEFNGSSYSSIFVNSNGGATFGTTTSTASAVISATTAYAGAIGVMNRDLWGVFVASGVTTSGSDVITNVSSFRGLEVGKLLNTANGIPAGATVTAFDTNAGTITMSAAATSSSSAAAVRWGTGRIVTSIEGTAPNREFVIEWIGYNDYATTAIAQSYLNFQLRLAETTNIISVVYGPQSSIPTTNRTNQIGLRGATNTDFNNRSGAVANPWTATSAGTANNASVSRDNTNFPDSGLTFTWSPPSCIAPGAFTFSNVATTSIDLAWDASSTPPSLGYEVFYSTTNATPATTATPNVTNISGLTTNLSSLTPATTYFVWVRSKCSSSDSSGWNSAGSFTTSCAPVTELTENFDSYATGSILPVCWARMAPTTTPGSQTITTTTPASGTRNIYFFTSATQLPVIAALPEFSNVNAGTHRLKFKARVGSGAPGSLTVGYVTDIFDNASFVTLEDIIINNTAYTAGADYSVIPPTTVPAGARLAIRTTNNDAKAYYFDDIVWEAVPSCFAPINPSLASATSNSISLTWNAPAVAPAIGYQVYYSITNTAPTAATVFNASNSVSSTTTTANITGLTSSTTYYVWVRSVCSAAEQSVWTFATFETACSTFTAPFTESFSTGALPLCWSNVNPTTASTSTNVFWKFGTGAGYGTTNNGRPTGSYAFVDASSPYTGENRVELISPSINLTGLVAPYVQFDWFKNHSSSTTSTILPAYDDNSLTVAINDGTGWVDIFSSTSNDPLWRTEGFTLASTYLNTTIQLRFTVNKDVAGNGYFYDDLLVDEIKVIETPSCFNPTAASITGSTASSLNLSWTAPASAPAVGYQVYYSTINTAPTAATVLDASNSVSTTLTTATIPGLTADTVYYVWVRSNCSASSQSSWESAGSAITGYCVPTGGTSSTSYYLNNITTTSGTTNLAYTASSYAAYVDNTASTFASFPGGTVNAALTAAGGSTYYFYTWVDWNNDLDFTDAGETILATTTYAASGTAVIAVPASQAIGNYRVRFATSYIGVLTSCGPAPWGNYVDYTLTISAPPSCSAPTALNATAVTTTSGSLSWTAPATAPANGYQVYYSITNTAPTAATVLNASNSVTSAVTIATIPGLTNATTYFAWVRSDCSASEKSAWTGSVTFTTDCNATTTPYTMNFDSATTPALPTCTSVVNDGTGNVWATITAPTGMTGNALYYEYNTTNPANTWFFTQGINMTAGTTYYIGYKYSNNGNTTYIERMKVAIGMGSNSTAMTNQIADYPNIDSAVPVFIQDLTFTPTVTGVYNLGFHAYSIADQFNLFLDDITVTTNALSTGESVTKKNSIIVYPNPFTDFIRLSDVNDVASIAVVDISGRIVKAVQPALEINLGNLTTGMYLISIIMNDGSVQTVKTIKK
jgi:hypothetical protein